MVKIMKVMLERLKIRQQVHREKINNEGWEQQFHPILSFVCREDSIARTPAVHQAVV